MNTPRKVLSLIILVTFLLSSCNPALMTRIYPTPLVNLNTPVDKRIGIANMGSDGEVSLEQHDMLKSSLAEAFSASDYLVFDQQSLPDDELKQLSITIKSTVLAASSQAPDPIDWLPIGLGFLLIVPGYFGYKADTATERRETKVRVEIEIVNARTNASLWKREISAERGDEMNVFEEHAYQVLYNEIAQKMVQVVESRW